MLKKLDPNHAMQHGIIGKSGNKYILESELSEERHAKLVEFMTEVSAGMSAKEIIANIAAAYEDLQHPRIMDAGQKLRKIIDAGQVLSMIPHPAIKACSLFFFEEGETLEQRQVFDESRMMQKIEDWKEYGIEGFFPLLTLIRSGSNQN